MNEYISYLNEGTLTDCVRICTSTIGYKVGIFVTSDEEVVDIIREFTDGVFGFWNDNSLPVHITSIVQSRNGSYITFSNRSVIRIYVYRGCMRGTRLHRILIDQKIDSNTIDTVLSPFVIKYDASKWDDYRRQQMQNEADVLFKLEYSDVNKTTI